MFDSHLSQTVKHTELTLFHSYHQKMNAFIILLDPHLHEVVYVRQTSPVLFTTILAVSAKFVRPQLYPSLLMAAKQLVGRGIIDGQVSVGLVQSLLLQVYWKEPEDCSAWLRVGEAIRMGELSCFLSLAIESARFHSSAFCVGSILSPFDTESSLRLFASTMAQRSHRSSPLTGYQLHLHTRRTTALPDDDLEARQILDRERTWIDLYCFDQTFFLQSGEDDDVHQTCMIPHHKIDVRSWLNETKRFGVEDDLEQGANFECAFYLLCSSRTITHPPHTQMDQDAATEQRHLESSSLSCSLSRRSHPRHARRVLPAVPRPELYVELSLLFHLNHLAHHVLSTAVDAFQVGTRPWIRVK